MDLDRRSFVKLAAMASATAAAGRGADAVEAPPVPALDGVRWNKAPCRFCGTGCHVQVGVEKGRVVAIAGDPKADVNRGLLCVKGYHVGLALYGKDRLTRPLLKQDGGYVPISWDRALDVIADRHEVACDAPKALARANYLLCYAEKLRRKLSAM